VNKCNIHPSSQFSWSKKKKTSHRGDHWKISLRVSATRWSYRRNGKRTRCCVERLTYWWPGVDTRPWSCSRTTPKHSVYSPKPQPTTDYAYVRAYYSVTSTIAGSFDIPMSIFSIYFFFHIHIYTILSSMFNTFQDRWCFKFRLLSL
jgi:hypothetical protein